MCAPADPFQEIPMANVSFDPFPDELRGNLENLAAGVFGLGDWIAAARTAAE